MGRPWWYDSYWEKDEKPRRSFRPPRRKLRAWLIILALTLILTLSNSGSRASGSAALLGLVNFVCLILSMAILIRVVISWFPVNRYHPAILLLDGVTEPILSRLRRILPLVGMFDFSPFVAIAILFLIPVIMNALLR